MCKILVKARDTANLKWVLTKLTLDLIKILIILVITSPSPYTGVYESLGNLNEWNKNILVTHDWIINTIYNAILANFITALLWKQAQIKSAQFSNDDGTP